MDRLLKRHTGAAILLRRCRASVSYPITQTYNARRKAKCPTRYKGFWLWNPTALAELKPGEPCPTLARWRIDVLVLLPRRPHRKAHGLDMTAEMLALAEENKRKSNLANVEF
jgi:hypothetical protein